MKPKGFPGLEVCQWLLGRMSMQLKNSPYFYFSLSFFFSESTVLCYKCLISKYTYFTYLIQFSVCFSWQNDKSGPCTLLWLEVKSLCHLWFLFLSLLPYPYCVRALPSPLSLQNLSPVAPFPLSGPFFGPNWPVSLLNKHISLLLCHPTSRLHSLNPAITLITRRFF